REIYAALQKCVASVATAWKREKRQADRDDRLHEEQLERLRRQRQSQVLTITEAAYRVMGESYGKVSDNGTLPANARQIMYVARPLVLKLTGGKCWRRSSTFTQKHLPNFVRNNPEMTASWDVVYDARGQLHEPHTNRRVPLGTLQVRDYRRGWQDSFPDE